MTPNSMSARTVGAVFFLLLMLAGCGRPLAPNERAFAEEVFRDDLNLDRVRVVHGFNPRPVPRQVREVDVIPRQSGICDRIAPATVRPPPGAWALYNQVHFAREFYLSESMPHWPKGMLLPQGLMLLHELVHVWQWQNRSRTGYRPIRAALESVLFQDPYFNLPSDDAPFLDRGFEQQAALLEDYVCFALFDPSNARRAKIRPFIAPFFRMDRIDQIFDGSRPPAILLEARPDEG